MKSLSDILVKQSAPSVKTISNQHTRLEDFFALLTGTFMISFGLLLMKNTGIMTGGTAGLSLLIHYISHWQFGVIFFVINLPFYYLAYKRMGMQLVIKTFVAVGLLSFFSLINPKLVQIAYLNPIFASILANILVGVGMLILFRHRSSLGGVNLLALFIQNHYKIPAGKFQLGVDLVILCVSGFFVDLQLLLFSILGSVILNLIITCNHKESRYIA
ncbi:TPA: YitT family protein [Acinetobacter baumannii]